MNKELDKFIGKKNIVLSFRMGLCELEELLEGEEKTIDLHGIKFLIKRHK
jgi:hypothetical protein